MLIAIIILLLSATVIFGISAIGYAEENRKVHSDLRQAELDLQHYKREINRVLELLDTRDRSQRQMKTLNKEE